MRNRMLLLTVGLLVLGACQTSSLTESEKAPVPESDVAFSGGAKRIDTNQSHISFIGKSNIVNHEGKFNTYTADITLDFENPADLEQATIEAEIDIASVEVDAAGLQGHLMKEEFFDVEHYPTATFASTRIVSKGDNQYEVTGDLTVKNMTKSVIFTAEITDAYITAQYDFPRKEFGIGNDSYGQKLLEETVPVDVKLVFQE